jgi:hypothetical protein
MGSSSNMTPMDPAMTPGLSSFNARRSTLKSSRKRRRAGSRRCAACKASRLPYALCSCCSSTNASQFEKHGHMVWCSVKSRLGNTRRLRSPSFSLVNELDNLLRECNFPSTAVHSGIKQEERYVHWCSIVSSYANYDTVYVVTTNPSIFLG